MSLVLIPVKIRAVRANGAVVAGARVRARLTVEERDGGIIVPDGVDGETDESGECTLNLWPNSRGVNGSNYRVVIDGGNLIYFSGVITVPEVPSTAWPVLMDSLINQPPYPARSVAEQAQMASAANALQVAADAALVLAAKEVVVPAAAQATTSAAASVAAAAESDASADRAAAAANARTSIAAALADSTIPVGASFSAPLADGAIQAYLKESGTEATPIGEPFITRAALTTLGQTKAPVEISSESGVDHFLDAGALNGYVNTSGSFVALATWITTPLIAIKDNAVYDYTGTRYQPVVCQVSGYDENQNYVGVVFASASMANVHSERVVVTDPTVKFIRASALRADPFAFVETVFGVKEGALPSSVTSGLEAVQAATQVVTTNHFLDAGAVDGYINTSGALVVLATWITTPLIAVKGNVVYDYTGTRYQSIVCQVSGYDEDHNFVGIVFASPLLTNVQGVRVAVSNPAIKFIRASALKAEPYAFVETAYGVKQGALPDQVASGLEAAAAVIELVTTDYAQGQGITTGYVNTSGDLVFSVNWRTTPFVRVLGGDIVKFSGTGGTLGLVSSVSMWDENAQYIGTAYAAPPSTQVTDMSVTIPAAAKFIRASSSINGYAFHLKVTALAVKPGKTPELNEVTQRVSNVEQDLGFIAFSPRELYAVMGEDLYLYPRGIVPDESIDVAWNVETGNEKMLRVSPQTNADINLKLTARVGLRDIVASEFTVKVTGGIQSPATPQNFIPIGDSTTAGTSSLADKGPWVNELSRRLTGVGTAIYPDVAVPARALTNIIFRGTRGDWPVKHEGRGSWRIFSYLNSAVGPGSITNAFWNPATSQYDIDYYLSANNFTDSQTPDGVVSDGSNLTLLVDCIWNDVYNATPEYSAAQMRLLIEKTWEKKPETKFIISGLNPPPDLNYKAFTGQRVVSQLQVFDLAIRRIGEAYRAMLDDLNDPKVSWLDIAPQFDPYENSYTRTNQRISNRSTTIVQMCFDHVHPAPRGYAQWADAFYLKILYDYCRA